MRVQHLLLASLVLLAIPLSAQEAERLPGDPNEHLDAAVRARMGLADPSHDDLEAETLQPVVSSRLAELGTWLASDEPDDALDGLLAEGARAEELPAALTGRGNEGDGVSSIPPWRVSRSPAGPAEEGTTARQALVALRGLLTRLGTRSSLAVKLKVDGIAREEGGLVLARARFAAHGEGEGRAQARTRWVTRWSFEAADAPRLVSLSVGDLETVRGPAEPLLVDATGALFADVPAFREQLLPGVDAWRRRLDSRLEIPLLGHPAGLALGDVNGDLLDDLYVCQPGGLPNRLFLRRVDGGLEDASARSGTDLLEFTRSALILDLDGDGDRDLAAAVPPELLVLENDGEARFQVATRLPAEDTTSLAAADYDGDGDLDLYACSYVTPYEGLSFPLPYHDAENGHPNTFFRNEGGLAFTDATAEVGLDRNNTRFSFAASWEDYDGDGDPDLYVANDFGRNNLYRNDGGTFVDVAAEAGVEDVSAGMGVSWADADGDGRFDLHVSNMDSGAGKRVTYQRTFRPDAPPDVIEMFRRHARGDSLFLNRGDGTFEDASPGSGASEALWAWGGLFCDLQNDGLPDLVVPNGFLTQELADDL